MNEKAFKEVMKRIDRFIGEFNEDDPHADPLLALSANLCIKLCKLKGGRNCERRCTATSG